MRKFYRCKDCLGVAAVDYGEPISRHFWEELRCACGGQMEFMGNVERGNLTKTTYDTPCDDRCVGALGPHCDCHCGGANHGSMRIIRVTRVVGKVPEVSIGADSLRKGQEFQKLYGDVLQAWGTKYAEVTEKKNRGTWLSRDEFMFYLEGMSARRRLHKVRDMKVYSLRTRKLAELITLISRGSESVSREAHNLENRVQLPAPQPTDIRTGEEMETDIVHGLSPRCRCHMYVAKEST